MLHQLLFLVVFFALLPTVLLSAFAGALIYKWLEYLPPAHAYSVSFLPGYISLAIGTLTFIVWVIKEQKSPPRPPGLMLLLAALVVWISITTLFALAPDAAYLKWDRTVKVLGFAMLTAQMLSNRERLEAYAWVLVLCTAYYAIPGAGKFIASGGGGQVGSGMLVVGDAGSFIGDRVAFAVALPMMLPLALYLGRYATLLPATRYLRPAMLGVALFMVLALIGTYARTALFSGGAMGLMMLRGGRRKVVAVLAAAAIGLAVYTAAPESWFERMDSVVHYQQDASAEGRLVAWSWAWQTALEHPIVGGGFRVFVLNEGLIPERRGYVEAHNIFFEMLAEHGFVGLGLLCWILIAGYRACLLVARRVRGRDELAWAGALARAAQIGIVVFAAGGMFISIATSPFLYDLIAIVIGVRTVVERELAAEARVTDARRRPAAAALAATAALPSGLEATR